MEPTYGAVHKWIQQNFRNGDRVTWGSGDVLGEVTVKQLEELSEEINAETKSRMKVRIIGEIKFMQFSFTGELNSVLDKVISYIAKL